MPKNWDDIINSILDRPGTFLPWQYNDQATPQQQFRDEDQGKATARVLRNRQIEMELQQHPDIPITKRNEQDT